MFANQITEAGNLPYLDVFENLEEPEDSESPQHSDSSKALVRYVQDLRYHPCCTFASFRLIGFSLLKMHVSSQ